MSERTGIENCVRQADQTYGKTVGGNFRFRWIRSQRGARDYNLLPTGRTEMGCKEVERKESGT